MDAAKLWAATLGTVLVLDAILVRRDQETLSEWYKRHALILVPVTGYLLCHLHGQPSRWCRYDPLSLAANRIRVGRTST